MALEQKNGKTLSSFERLTERFKQIPEAEDKRYRDFRNIRLEDGTKIEIVIGRSFSRSESILSYSVQIEPFVHSIGDAKNLDNQALKFKVDEDGLDSLSLPDLMVKIGDEDYVAVHMPIAVVASPQRKTALAESMVDWLDKVIRDNKYSNPPISTSIFR